MTPSIGIQLSGTLGERHRRMNALVHEACHKNIPCLSIQGHEEAAIDRLFKIDFASKQKNLDYIIGTLKDDDMLFVSRALKSLWILGSEYSHIINPIFLEDELFTQMTLQAVNKMKHWIQLHLKEHRRCCEFYQFYKGRDFDFAAKFLWHTSSEFILNEFTGILDKITPKHLKLLSEKVPQVTKIYFENLKHNQTLIKYYLDNESKFLANVKFILKIDTDVFFYVIENFFVYEEIPLFSSEITKHIVRNHKNRFIAKRELYAAWFLDMKTLARCLDSEEVKDLVLKLAKAEFLSSWFSYKRVEPLIKRLKVEERTTFRKFVFVDKAYGPKVKEWPYSIPARPILPVSQTALFEDRVLEPPSSPSCQLCSGGGLHGNFASFLDQLFEQYRFSSFDQTLIELRKKLRAENSPQMRQHMLLVLVSKTGGRAEALASLFDLLSQHKNEPVHVRAAIVRSLVKRAFIWRLAPEQWSRFLEWGHGLGLDGSPPEPSSTENLQRDVVVPKPPKPNRRRAHPNNILALMEMRCRLEDKKAPAEIACNEGLHAVVIRDLLANVTPSDAVRRSFLDKFSSLAEYSLSSEERKCIRSRLPAWLLAESQSCPNEASSLLHLLLDTLFAYHIRFDEFPGTVEAVVAIAKRDFESAKRLLVRLYKAGVARKMLIREYFEMNQNDASYVNALRHDMSILENTQTFEKIIAKKGFKHERFIRKLALYFIETDGLGDRYRAVLELQAATNPCKTLARPLALLAGSNFPLLLKTFDAAAPKTPQRQLAAALRSNAREVRPHFHVDAVGWRAAGAKAVANQLSGCRQKDVERYLPDTLSWNRTFRLALVLAKRVNKEHEVYEVFASKRPGAALKTALKYFRREGNNSDPRIWHSVRAHIAVLDQKRCYYSITKMDFIPAIIKPEYCVTVYKASKKCSKKTALSILYNINAVLHEVDGEFILQELTEFLSDVFTEKMVLRMNYDDLSRSYLYVDFIAKYLLLSTSEEMCKERFENIGIPFFKRIEHMWKKFSNDISSLKRIEYDFLDDFISSLSYIKAFFDTRYICCSIVFDKVIEWMQSFMPIEKWFKKYMIVHITMVYLKSIRFCLERNPNLFSDESTKLQGVNILGNIFGKFMASEIEELTQKYFPSVTKFYAKELELRFVRYYFNAKYDKSIEIFAKGVVNGLLSIKKSAPVFILAKSVYKINPKLKDDEISNILRSFENSEDIELRFRAQMDDHFLMDI